MYSKSVIAAIGFALAGQAFAQQDAVVVTGTRFPEKQLEHPIGVTVITREQIADSTAANLPELLSRYAGVNTRNNSGSPDVAIDLRGFGASGDQNTLVLLDGQRLNDIELTTVGWSAIPLQAVERVEIQRGGGAVLYGGGASGGTINIITRSPIAGAKSASVSASRGSYNTDELNAAVNLAGTNTGFSLSANQHDSDNYRVNNRLEQGSALGDLRWTGDRAGLVFKFGLDNQSLRLPGARSGVQLGTDPRGSATPNDYSARDGQQATLSGRYAFDAAEFAVDVSYRDTRRIGFFDDYSGFGFSTFTDTHAKVWALTPRLKKPYQLLGRDSVLIVGMDADLWITAGCAPPASSSSGRPKSIWPPRRRIALTTFRTTLRSLPRPSLRWARACSRSTSPPTIAPIRRAMPALPGNVVRAPGKPRCATVSLRRSRCMASWARAFASRPWTRSTTSSADPYSIPSLRRWSRRPRATMSSAWNTRPQAAGCARACIAWICATKFTTTHSPSPI